MKVETKKIAQCAWASEHLIGVLTSLPDEVTIIDLCGNDKITTDELWLIHDYLGYSFMPEDVLAFNKRCDIVDSAAIFHSTSIINSSAISDSQDIEESTQVTGSKRVTHGKLITGCSDISHCERVAYSDYVASSKDVAGSTNVSESTMVCNSNFVFKSSGIYNSKEVNNSTVIFESTAISDCAYSSKLTNCHDCLFCYDVTDGEFLVFNKSVPEWHYNMICKRLEGFNLIPNLFGAKVGLWLEDVAATNPTRRFTHYPDNFWAWLKTLPNFNPDIIQTITLHLIKD